MFSIAVLPHSPRVVYCMLNSHHNAFVRTSFSFQTMDKLDKQSYMCLNDYEAVFEIIVSPSAIG